MKRLTGFVTEQRHRKPPHPFGHGGSFINERAFRPVTASDAALFPILLAGKAQADTGDGLEACFGDGFTAFTAAGLAVYPFRAFLKSAGRRLTQSGFAFDAFEFGRLIKNVQTFS